jgi:PAS domain S-box-containing protein
MSKAKTNPPETDIWYRLLFEATPWPMLIYDRQSFSFLDVNRSALELYGYSRSEWLKMSVRHLHPTPNLETVSNELAMMSDASFHRAGIWRHLRKDGTEMFVEILLALRSQARRIR